MSAPHFVYRQYDNVGALLYIGCTRDPEKRDKQHRYGSPWGDEIAGFTVEAFPDQESALRAEAAAIREERPQYNVTHSVIPRWYKVESPSDVPVKSYKFKETLPLQEAAESLGISPSTLRAQIRRGTIGAGVIGYMLFVPKEEIERYRRENHGKRGKASAAYGRSKSVPAPAPQESTDA